MEIDSSQLKSLILKALSSPDGETLAAFLKQEFDSNPELHNCLRTILAARESVVLNFRPLSTYETLANSRASTSADNTEPATFAEGDGASDGLTTGLETENLGEASGDQAIGTLIAGRYRIRREIGVGGMGRVYLADQIQPIQREVALKLIKGGVDSRSILARFESERQALAIMDHPHIAKVFDAGTTESGRPFFVMQLVRGGPLTDYCEEHRLGIPERLGLFTLICQAVHHAHQKGIIHRDLKPSNILVDDQNGTPSPRIIDFGLAKATTESFRSNEPGCGDTTGLAGTPLYMAPEQASINSVDVDTRADLYGLGVILYELLTGSTPTTLESIRRLSVAEALKQLRESTPPTPSQRARGRETTQQIASTYSCKPSRFAGQIAEDLDWIVMKAIAKDREARYQSAVLLAQDLDRYQRHLPVSAGPVSTAYVLKKFVRRNRARVAVASLLFLAMLGGIIGTTFGLIQAEHQKDIALAQKTSAEERLVQLGKANEILGSIFKGLDPTLQEKDGKPLSELLGERLDQAAEQIDGKAIGNPLTVAKMQETLGDCYMGLGYAGKAIDLFTRAHAAYKRIQGARKFETLAVANKLAQAYVGSEQFAKAVSLHEQTLELQTATLGIDHPDSLTTMNDLAIAYFRDGQTSRAEALFEKTCKLRSERFGRSDLETATVLNNLGEFYRAVGKPAQARQILEEALSYRTDQLGPDHVYTLITMNNLACCYQDLGEIRRSIDLFVRLVELETRKLGRNYPETMRSMNNLAYVCQADGQTERALRLHEETLALRRAKLGVDHADTLLSMNNVTISYVSNGQLEKGAPYFTEALQVMESKGLPEHPDTLRLLHNLGMIHKSTGKLDLAISLLLRAFTQRQKVLGKAHPETLISQRNLAVAYQQAGRLDDARQLLNEAAELCQSGPEPQLMPYATILVMLGSLYIQREELDLAESNFRGAIKVCEQNKFDNWVHLDARARLGAVLMRRGMLDDAENLLRAGYEGLKRQADSIPPFSRRCVGEALDQLIELARLRGQTSELSRWETEKASLASLCRAQSQ